MAMFWGSLVSSRWLIFMNSFVGLFLLVCVIKFAPKEQFSAVMRWSETTSPPVPTRIIPCSPKKNIVFLKTHKTGSTSVQNILLRYANTKNLTVVIPVDPTHHYLSLSKPFRKEMVANAPWESLGYNILCHHMVFNKAAIEKLMPKDSIYVSILRDPVAQFESMYEYDDLKEHYKMDIEDYARGTKNSSIAPKLRNRYKHMGRNQMLYDFGVHPSYFNSRPMVQQAISKMEKYFDFIMITEYFDESIVLLKHVLCWDLDDVISFTINARMTSFKNNLTNTAIRALREWNWGDQIFYNHFLKKFNETVEEFGRDQMSMEIRDLKERRQEWIDYCVEKEVESRNLTAFHIWSNKVTGYKLKHDLINSTCQDLVKPETYFTSQIRQHQLIRSLESGAPILNFGPAALRRIIDISQLKGRELEVANDFLQNQYKYRRRKFSRFNRL